MELLEYYYIIRRRITTPLLTAVILVVLVVGAQLLLPKPYPAQGQMLAMPGAAMQVQWGGADVSIIQENDMWGTLQQVIASRALLAQAARADQLPPTSVDALRAFQYSRNTRGSAFFVKGFGATPAQAKVLTDDGMQALATYWNSWRLDRARNIRHELEKELQAQQPQLDALQGQVDKLESGDNPGKPADVLAAVENQASQLQGSAATTKVDVGIARDRLTALGQLADHEQSLPPAQRALIAPTGAAATLQSRLADLQTQRATMLLTRTPAHPAVRTLDQQIKDVQQQLAAMDKQDNSDGGTRDISPALAQQITMARLDYQGTQRRYDALVAQETALRASIPVLQEKVKQYRDIQDKLQPLQNQQTTILTNLKTLDSEIDRLQRSQDLRVIDAAEPLPGASAPRRLVLTGVAAALGGFLLGCLLIIAFSYVDLTFANEVEAEQMLSYPVLAGIPHFRGMSEHVPELPAGDTMIATLDQPGEAEAPAASG